MSAQTTVRPNPVGRTRPVLSVLAAIVCALAVAALAAFSVGTASGQRLDQLVLSGAQADASLVSHLSVLALTGVRMPVIAGTLVLTAVLVIARRRAGLLLPLGALVIGANLTTQALKLLVGRDVLGPGIEITPNSFPSGHTTLAASAVVVLVLASGRARPLVALLGTLWITGTGAGTVVAGWHRPSDVVGAITVPAAWTFLVLAIDGLRTRRLAGRTARSGRGRRRATSAAGARAGTTGALDLTTAILLALVGLGTLALGVTLLQDLELPLRLDDTAHQSSAYLAAVAVIGGGTALWMALVLVLRTPEVRRGTPGDRVP